MAGVHFYNSSGTLADSAVSGALVTGCTGNAALLHGNGMGVQADTDSTATYKVNIERNSIHDFTRNGVLAVGAGMIAGVIGNTITGPGRAAGVFQFGVFILNGAIGIVTGNIIHEGLCETLSFDDCLALRSEGITLRAAGDNTAVNQNIIVNAQSGIFINGGNRYFITDNVIIDIDTLDGIDVEGTASGFLTNSVFERNSITGVVPVDNYSCGIYETPGTGVSNNVIGHTTTNNGFCGVAYVTGEKVSGGTYHNVLYTEFNADVDNPGPLEPSAAMKHVRVPEH